MDVSLSSCLESALFQTLSKSPQSDLSYKIKQNFPNASRQIISVNPTIAVSGDPSGQNVSFNLPRYGMIQSLVIESTLTSSAQNVSAVENNLGERIFSNVELRNHNLVISSQTDGSCHTRGQTEVEDGNGGNSMNLAHNVVTNVAQFSNESVTVYTPVYFSWYDDIRMNVSTKFVEQLTLDCTVNTLARAGLVSLSAGVFKLWVTYYNLQESSYQDLVSRNFKPERNLSMLQTNVYQERFALTNGATSSTVDLKCSNLVSAMHFFIKDDLTSVTAAGLFKPITTFSLSVSGNTLFSSIPSDIMVWDSSRYGGFVLNRLSAVAGAPTENGERVSSIYFKLDKSRLSQTGAISFANINNPQLTVTHADPGNTTHILYVVYEYMQLVSINSQNGDIIAGLSQ